MTTERKREILAWMYRHGIKPEGVMAKGQPSRTSQLGQSVVANPNKKQGG